MLSDPERALVFCQMGRFVEFYGPQRLLAAHILGLLRGCIARAGFAFSVGFPLRLSAAYISRAVSAGYTVVEVREVGHLGPRCAQRQVMSVWIPARWANQAPAGGRHRR